MLEIYNEQVRDLLQKSNPKGGLAVRQNPKEGLFYVQNLKKAAVGSYKEIERRVDEGKLLDYCAAALPYSDKWKQLLKMKFLLNELNVTVMYIDINAISLYLDLNIFQQDECPN